MAALHLGLASACDREPFAPGKVEDLRALIEDGQLEPMPGPKAPEPPGEPMPAADPEPVEPVGSWEMDDCSPDQTELRATRFNSFSAFRTIGVTCGAGVEGQGVSLPGKKDLVYVPDQPVFTFAAGVTIAAWLNPSQLGGSRTIFRKREGELSSVALMAVGESYTFVIDRQDGEPAAVSARAMEGQWTHVAGTYDGTHLRLYINGELVASQAASGQIRDGEGPLLIGNDMLQRRFEGMIDKVWFDTRAAAPETIRGLLCLHRLPEMVALPEKTEPLPPGTPVTFEFAVTNRNTETCPRQGLFFSYWGNRSRRRAAFPEDWTFEPPSDSLRVASGETGRLVVTVTSAEDADPGEYRLPFEVGFFPDFDAAATVSYLVDADTCRVSGRKELLIRDVSVVDDPIRTAWAPAEPNDRRRGVWTFKHLAEQLAPRPEDAPAMVQALFESFTTEQTVNGFTVGPRPGMRPIILDPWPRKDGQLDLEAAPVLLLAIVNRLDIGSQTGGLAGEGRFVFGLLDRTDRDRPLQATIIFEYLLPARTEAEVAGWAQAWHALGALPFPSEQYNAALAELTARFAGRGVWPGRPNGSALLDVRTNELAFREDGAPWQLREFRLDPEGRLRPAPLALTPDLGFDGTGVLRQFIVENEPAILEEQHQVPLVFQNQPFLAGAVFNVLDSWTLLGVVNPELRHKFALNTCNGCHSRQTDTRFTMIEPRDRGTESTLSAFLTGTTADSPFFGEVVAFDDLSRRNRLLRLQVCPAEAPPLPPVLTPPSRFIAGFTVGAVK